MLGRKGDDLRRGRGEKGERLALEHRVAPGLGEVAGALIALGAGCAKGGGATLRADARPLHPDDREATVRERLKQYHKNTEGLLNHYRSRGLLHEVHGIGTIDEIYDKIVQELKQAKPTC